MNATNWKTRVGVDAVKILLVASGAFVMMVSALVLVEDPVLVSSTI